MNPWVYAPFWLSRQKLARLSLVALALCFAFATVTKADEFSLTGTGSTTSINLLLSGNQSSTPGVFDITSIDSGTIDGQSATLIQTSAPGVVTNTTALSGWYIQFDNLLYTAAPYVDYWGLGFTLADGTIGNIYYNSGYFYAQLGDNPPFQEQLTLSAVQTPEPSSLLLMCGGLLILGGILTRKQLL